MVAQFQFQLQIQPTPVGALFNQHPTAIYQPTEYLGFHRSLPSGAGSDAKILEAEKLVGYGIRLHEHIEISYRLLV